MAKVLVIGDGPAGLSAALFLAKREQEVTVLGAGDTYVNAAYLYNYLGIDEIDGKEFMSAARQQVDELGAQLVEAQVESVEKDGVFTATTADGDTYSAEYLIVATGPKGRDLAVDLGANVDARGVIQVDRSGRTGVEKLYAAGWAARGDKIQAIISAGDGAAAALDILSELAGKEIHDFDTP